MAMKRSSTTASANCVWLVMGLTILVVSTQFAQVDCRALRSTTGEIVSAGGGCKEAVDGGEQVGMATFAVSSNYNFSIARPSARSLGLRLASGPSKKGPGH